MKKLSILILALLGICPSGIAAPKRPTPKLGEVVRYRLATAEEIRKLCGASANDEIEIAGIAGYTADKGRDSCIWLPKEGLAILAEIGEKWPAHLAGRPIVIVAKLSLYPRLSPDVQARSGDEGLVLLSKVRTKEGKVIKGD